MAVKLLTTSSEKVSAGRLGAPGPELGASEGAGVVVAVLDEAASVAAGVGTEDEDAALAFGVVVFGASAGFAAVATAAGFFGFVTITTKKSFGLIPQLPIESASFKTFPE